jgi:hypothetical protein
MTKMIYGGGHDSVTVVLPDRSLTVEPGEAVEVTADEAKLLATLPGWKAEKPATPKPSKETN